MTCQQKGYALFDSWSFCFRPLSDVSPHVIVAGILLLIDLLFCLGASFALKVPRFRWPEFQLLYQPGYPIAAELRRISGEGLTFQSLGYLLLRRQVSRDCHLHQMLPSLL